MGLTWWCINSLKIGSQNLTEMTLQLNTLFHVQWVPIIKYITFYFLMLTVSILLETYLISLERSRKSSKENHSHIRNGETESHWMCALLTRDSDTGCRPSPPAVLFSTSVKYFQAENVADNIRKREHPVGSIPAFQICQVLFTIW